MSLHNCPPQALKKRERGKKKINKILAQQISGILQPASSGISSQHPRAVWFRSHLNVKAGTGCLEPGQQVGEAEQSDILKYELKAAQSQL